MFVSPVSPRAVVGVASGGERNFRPPVGADFSRPGPAPPDWATHQPGRTLPLPLGPDPAERSRPLRRLGRLPLVCGRCRGVRAKGGDVGVAAVAATAQI